jgi:tetratricopeptide (TPR) repeat protein
LSPNHAEAYQFYSIYLRLQGRFEEGLRVIGKAQELDPVSPNISVSMGSLLFFARRYDEAVVQLRRAIELDPTFVSAHLYLGLASEQKSMYEEAIASLKKALSLAGNLPEFRAHLGHVYAVAGRRAEAQALLHELVELSKQRYISAYNMAFLQAGLGNQDQAFFWLEKAYEERCSDLALLRVDPRLDDLRGDSRFMPLLHRVGLG